MLKQVNEMKTKAKTSRKSILKAWDVKTSQSNWKQKQKLVENWTV